MQASNAPSKSPVPFAESGSKNTIPVASQIGVTPGLASFTDGFPPLTMTPLAAGGIPPRGQDFNGILYFLSAAARWGQAGGGYPYDAAFSTAIGGYPKGAMLKQAGASNGYWLNLVDNNTTNPDTGGANWIALAAGIASAAQAQAMTDNTVGLTPLRLADAFKGSNQALASSGFQKLPGGLILQWGNGTTSTGGSASIVLPVAFPNFMRAATASIASVATPRFICVRTFSPGSFGIETFNQTGSSVQSDFSWLAIGH
ncbi:gp53-like domain-containing protein [Achromobacter xylosoxidans]|uniref:gp53-like domain-containing protein n=1 Tax=Alcaligenes xylosoxydans xylosoxydans TaxID=85698 RepID=UPI001F0E66B4|nr:hypothetical protein [Achromobacter xylosoxidans]MCH4575008.1 hypothetical protein [Achromobacter xylosoxidans]